MRLHENDPTLKTPFKDTDTRRPIVVEALTRILNRDFASVVDSSILMQEAVGVIESGKWPTILLEALFQVLEELSAEFFFDFHHFGFLQPDRKTWDQSTAHYDGEVEENTLVDPRGHSHFRKYVRVPTEGHDVFLEYALFGEDGDGRYSVHFDLVHERAEELLDRIKTRLTEVVATIDGAEVFVTSFGGGTAPVGRVGARFISDRTIDVGVMLRTVFSDPKDW